MFEIIEKINQKQFIPIPNPPVKYFNGMDTEELFIENLKTQPEDWYYRHNTVTYTHNKHGYRAPEFEDIKWEESVVVFGCSNVYGTGLDDKDTLTSQLSQIINKPVINMGVGGASTVLCLHNAIILRNFCPKPLGVVNVWTEPSRTTLYNEKSFFNCGLWNVNEVNYAQEYIRDEANTSMYFLMNCLASRALWDDVKYYETTFFKQAALLANCRHEKMTKDRGKARDLRHPGKNLCREVAEDIATNLKL